jgi:hypothetical protein
MIDKTSVAESLHKLAEQVQESDPGGYHRLNLLKEAVQNNTSADAWAYADIHALIAPDSIVERYRHKTHPNTLDRIVTIMEVVRNTFIFAPIVLTWYAIAEATARYNEFVNAAIRAKKPDLYEQPFLYLWQQRFGGTLPEHLTLSNIAIIDVAILLIILIFTFFAYILANSSTAQKDHDAQLLRANLSHAITGAVLSLHARPQLTAADNLELVARNLDNTIRHVMDQVQTMSQQSLVRIDRMAQDVTTRVEKVSQETTTRFERVAHDITTQFTNATQQTGKNLHQIAHEMSQQMQAGKAYLTQLGSLTSGVVKTASEIQMAANILKTTNTSLINSVNSLVAPVDTMAKQQALLLDGVQQSAGLLQGNAKSIGDLIGKVQTMSKDLTQTVDTFTIAVEKLSVLGKEQRNLIQQQGSFVQHLQDEHDKQGQLAVLLSDATVSTKNALSEMNTGAISLRSMAVSMNDMMRLQATMVSNPGMAAAVDLSNITRHYENAAQMMEHSGKELTASAIAIQRASQQLREALDVVPTAHNNNQDTTRRSI